MDLDLFRNMEEQNNPKFNNAGAAIKYLLSPKSIFVYTMVGTLAGGVIGDIFQHKFDLRHTIIQAITFAVGVPMIAIFTCYLLQFCDRVSSKPRD